MCLDGRRRREAWYVLRQYLQLTSYLTAGGGSEGKPIGEVKVTAEGGTATIDSLGIYELNSGWKK